MNIVYLSLGSNIENRIEHCIKALDELSAYVDLEDVSSFYETEALGVTGQNNFINCAAKIKTPLMPLDLLSSLITTEKKLGRLSKSDYSPRTIDLDIIFYNDLTLKSDKLVIPHKQAHLRRFVIEPLCELCPDLIHPVLNKSISNILENISSAQIVKKIGTFYQ
ncbi:MAG TPA: 2-amino-4-hydroxy-6-hydroxymethyldihydropteridine diphosphokinase [Thermodesulfobacteriota bacterium]|nr:2-amino-4-hydroxy-6-hydroxymethyldihydropteridine diphosphokinase [Thermodesulfobacteriota bacterium]